MAGKCGFVLRVFPCVGLYTTSFCRVSFTDRFRTFYVVDIRSTC